ncbi:rrp5 [Symbiodinium natans]|uniref:Rrp5 protein n=1 Tax=Symbiodinium natans TaxID=878477 RepID=A0A812PJT9_9DINO|nr:rrp5 [Symbiodinium natans]
MPAAAPHVLPASLLRPFALVAGLLRISAERAGDEESWLKDADPPTPERAAAFLDCEGLGSDHIFWPLFRQALLAEGVFGETTLELAVRKWTEYESFQEDLFRRRDSEGGEMVMVVPGLTFANGSALETRIADLIDLPLVLQKAQFSHLFDDPPKWGPNEFAGFLACPVGFVLVQYVIFLANKVRAQLDLQTLKEYWEAMLNAFGSIYSVPNYVLDHSESANWGLTSTDIAVNINTEPGVYYPSYEDYCFHRPVPRPRLTAWNEDSPSLLELEASGPDYSALCSGRSKIPIALIGEHGPVNLDHLSTIRAALKEACGKDYQDPSVEVEAGHFFTYLWALEGTKEGDALRATLRISWEEFWGEPLTKSRGRTDGLPRWTVAAAVAALRGFAKREPLLRRSRLQICCEPLWLCVLLHAAMGSGHLLVRVSMCLLHAFAHIFGEQELPAFWPLVRALGEDLQKQGRLSAAATISAEMLNYQSGIRPAYVPALSLHVAASAQYAPTSADVLFFRFRLPGAPGFIRILEMLSAEARAQGVNFAKIVIMDATQKSLSFAEISSFRALALLPHVPYAQRLPDVFALNSPTLVPALPLLQKYVWPYAGPFCGRTDSELSQALDPMAANTTSHPYSPFTFQGKIFQPDRFNEDRRYWVQYTEWELWPHLIRFRSAREMLQLATMTQAEASVISTRMRQHHEELRRSSLHWWRLAAAAALH